MRVKEILILAAELACRRDLADYLAGKNGEDASARARESLRFPYGAAARRKSVPAGGGPSC